jgi:hypothetical protein
MVFFRRHGVILARRSARMPRGRESDAGG